MEFALSDGSSSPTPFWDLSNSLPISPPARRLLKTLVGSCNITWRTQAFINVSDFSKLPSPALLATILVAAPAWANHRVFSGAPQLPCVLLMSGLALVGSFIVGALLESRSRRKSQARAAASGAARQVAAASTIRLDDADLRSSFGSNTLARVGCDVDREATVAWTVLDISLSPDQQITMLAWAEAEIHGFLTSSCDELVDRGWRNERPGRWHLLAYDGPAWESNLDYAATVTLRGPIVPAQAAQILARLREHMAGLSLSQDQDDWVDLKLALCAKTRWQAVMQAVLLTSELGYPVENVDVLPV